MTNQTLGHSGYGRVSCLRKLHGFGLMAFICLVQPFFMSGSIFAQESQPKRSPLGDAFRSMFHPGPRSMGLIQRTNYFDDLLDARDRLEIALVIDGTDSMGEQLAGVQSQLGSLIRDLRRVVRNQLAVQMLIYRDVGAASGTISWPLLVDKKSWATEDVDIAKGLSKLVPESGAPYYYEPVDVAVYTALTDLNWSKDENVTRWMFVIGDAPPYQPGFREEANQAERKYDTEVLKRLAVEKNVKIYGIICPSREKDQSIHEQVLPECRQFFQELTDGTSGSLLDLNDVKQVQEIQVAADRATQRISEFKPITKSDLAEARKAQKKPLDKVVVAVVPFLEVGQMTFNQDNKLVRLAEELRSELNTNKIHTIPLSKLLQAYKTMPAKFSKDDKVFAQKLATAVGADYAIWRHQPVNGDTFQVAVINSQTGKVESISDPIETNRKADENRPINVRLCSQVIQSLASKTRNMSTPIARIFTFTGQIKTRLVSSSEDGTQVIEKVRLMVQRSLKSTANNSTGEELQQAKQLLESVQDSMNKDPLWNNLMANVYFGLALEARAQKKSAADLLQRARKHGEIASRADEEYLADLLFYQKNYEEAIKRYESIVTSAPDPDATRRAHWMLVFLYAGDWNVDEHLKQPEKAREHAIALLALFPESEETAALKLAIHWDEKEQRSQRPVLVLEDPSPADAS